jgi:predicted transcriptional regulator
MAGYNGTGRPFTPEEDERIDELRSVYANRRRYDSAGCRLPEPGSIREVAKAMGRHPASVHKRIHYLARRDS